MATSYLSPGGYVEEVDRGSKPIEAVGTNTGGFIGDLCSGILYLLSVWLGYNQPDVAGHVHDYGTKFLVTAGLLNVLAMVDVFEIAAGRKD